MGLKRLEITEAEAGDIIAISGLPDISVGETVCEVGAEEALPHLRIDEPTLQMTFGVNTSPFAGRDKDSKFLTARQLEDRLNKELQKDIALRVLPNDSESWIVCGRGELHLSILIENLRREGFELQVSKPKVIIKEENGVRMEPYEDLEIETPEEYMGSIIEILGTRGGIMQNMTNNGNTVRLEYVIPSRGLIGFSTNFMTLTRGYGIMAHTYKEYRPIESINIGERKIGVLVSVDEGTTTAYALGSTEERGTLFVEPGVEVYEGMIVGENARENDLAVNVTKGKALTNMRAAGSDHTVVLKRPRPITLEYAIDYINEDELVEVTPHDIRLRKKTLNTEMRKKEDARK
jgi:GTP-binding protein